MADDGEDRKADSEGYTEREGVENSGGEDHDHESELREATDLYEELDVMGRFFYERISDN